MQASPRHVSLNGVRAFEAAARLRSLKAAAIELGVTASAVSHQIRQLEAAVGTRLFARRHNAVELTAEGAGFYSDVGPAILTITRARLALQRDAHSVTVKSAYSLAVRWLIPRLNAFQASHPRIRVSVETKNYPVALGPGIDVALPYVRKGRERPAGTLLLVDESVPVGSAALVASAGNGRLTLPLISTAAEDWNWRAYAAGAGLDFDSLRIAGRFDTDQAAVEACLAGLGIGLLTRALIGKELTDGSLVEVPGLPAAVLGEYWIVAAAPRRPSAEQFLRWLERLAADARA
jgi:LysR family transcriptional regulator, glycine cleavage system transcriptional activator